MPRPKDPTRAIEQVVALHTLDDLRLVDTLVSPSEPTVKGVVFVYEGGVTREEG